jgi:hypothetical protein
MNSEEQASHPVGAQTTLGGLSARDLVFVSHATPEDNEFSRWLPCFTHIRIPFLVPPEMRVASICHFAEHMHKVRGIPAFIEYEHAVGSSRLNKFGKLCKLVQIRGSNYPK